MGYVVKGRQGEKTPQVKFTRRNDDGTPGAYFIGKKVCQKAIDKKTVVFEFELEDAHEKTPIVFSLGHETYEDAPVGPGSKVAMFGKIDEQGRMDQLCDKLDQVTDGLRIKVTYNGKVLNPKSGRKYKDFTVEVL